MPPLRRSCGRVQARCSSAVVHSSLTRRRQLVALATCHALLASYSSRDYAEVAGDSATSTFRENETPKMAPGDRDPK